MAENTGIEWATHTFNPWVGCTKVSPACDNCYAERWAERFGEDVWGAGKQRRKTTTSNWNQPLKWARQARETGDRPRVFCASLADVFDNEVPPHWRDELFELIRQTPELDWLLLTKRIGNAQAMLPDDWGYGYPNVWLGATIVTQDEADRDVAKLLATPATVRFVSAEPLLGPIDFNALTDGPDNLNGLSGLRENPFGATVERRYGAAIDCVIVGGESGPNARPMAPQWVRDIRDQCVEAGSTFFFKQWGEWMPLFEPGSNPEITQPADTLSTHLPDGTSMFWVGKKHAGNLIDGERWQQVPDGSKAREAAAIAANTSTHIAMTGHEQQ